MPMAKLCLLSWMEPRRVAHPMRAGVGDGNTYHQKVNKLLTKLNIYFSIFFKTSIAIIFFYSCLYPSDIVVQSLTWQNIQKQLMMQRLECDQLLSKKAIDNKEFFNLQQQLGAIYLAQKRYSLGFGTAFMPSAQSVRNYVHKKTFLDLKTKELLPLYKKKVLEYQKRYATGELERIQKSIKKLEALNLLHLKLFDHFCADIAKKTRIDSAEITEIKSIESCLKALPLGKTLKKSANLLSWITPVAGINDNQSPQIWQPIEGAIVLCPDNGTIAAIHYFEKDLVVFIKQHHFTYVIKGFSRCCVKVGEKVKQGEPLGMCALENPRQVELQLWRDDIILNPEPYHQVVIL